MPKRKRGITGMLPVDEEAIIKREGELLKLKKKRSRRLINYASLTIWTENGRNKDKCARLSRHGTTMEQEKNRRNRRTKEITD
ncbi:hypothetical protein AVEN_133056-1 [Araneus ventricosus]|uniref:Uncharacterized protein n=1 Tax=Araneus ventricosus TaxID=182803 RepID=A0A4Y2PCW9_ARAVE|nr:hypothetical protein AVEN_133056-1 [Araneus ventricosus]